MPDATSQQIFPQLIAVLGALWPALKAWFWVVLPFLVLPWCFAMWLWRRQQLWAENVKYIVLEIILPEEVPKPMKAMENVFSSLWAVYDPVNWREKWLEGKFLLRLSLEIAGIDGHIHFYIRAPEPLRHLVESSVYAQYPDVEIKEVPDYTKQVPADIPNEQWDLWGTGYQTLNEDVYPLRTYHHFFEPSGEMIREEKKRIDPLAVLLEGMAKLKPGEQMWMQFVVKPLTNKENDAVDRAKAIVSKLVGRKKVEIKAKPIFQEAAELLIAGRMPGEPSKEEELKELYPPETKLTPGEREAVKAVEDKVGKYFFECWLRFIYLGKREVFYKPNIKVPIGFFVQFSTQSWNGLKPWKRTTTAAAYYLAKRRTEFRKRRIMRLYRARLWPQYPMPYKTGGKEGVMILNTEELATLYHFPSRELVPIPTIQRVEAKRREAPPELPV